jgi:hypothetical protein
MLRDVATDRNGQVYVLQSRSVTALTPDGREAWRAKLPRGRYVTLSADVHGRVNVGEAIGDGKGIRVRVLSQTGKPLGSWKVDASADHGRMAFDREGRLLVSDRRVCRMRLFARPARGVGKLWTLRRSVRRYLRHRPRFDGTGVCLRLRPEPRSGISIDGTAGCTNRRAFVCAPALVRR